VFFDFLNNTFIFYKNFSQYLLHLTQNYDALQAVDATISHCDDIYIFKSRPRLKKYFSPVADFYFVPWRGVANFKGAPKVSRGASNLQILCNTGRPNGNSSNVSNRINNINNEFVYY